MALTSAEKQKEYRQRHAEKRTRLDVFLTNSTAELLSQNAKDAKLTKAEYISVLIHGGIDVDGLNNYIEQLTMLANKFTVLPSRVTDSKITGEGNRVTDKSSPCEVTGGDGYDGASSLNEAVAKLIGCSQKNTVKTSKIIKQARRELKISLMSKNLPASMKVRIYNRVKKMTNSINTIAK